MRKKLNNRQSLLVRRRICRPYAYSPNLSAPSKSLFWRYNHDFVLVLYSFYQIFTRISMHLQFLEENFKKGLHFVFRCAMIIKPSDTGQQKWGISSVGRAPHWQCGGQRFEPAMLHQNGMQKMHTVFSFSFFNIRKKGSNRQTLRMDPFLFICSHQIAAAPAKGCVWGFTTVLSKPSRLLPASAVRRSSLSGWPSKNLLHWHSEANNGLPLPCSLQWLYRSAAKLPQIHP